MAHEKALICGQGLMLVVDGRGTLTPADQGSVGALPIMLLRLLTVHVHRLVTARNS